MRHLVSRSVPYNYSNLKMATPHTRACFGCLVLGAGDNFFHIQPDNSPAPGELALRKRKTERPPPGRAKSRNARAKALVSNLRLSSLSIGHAANVILRLINETV